MTGFRRAGVFLAVSILLGVATVASAATASEEAQADGVPAVFDGAVIDLSEGWRGAEACLYWPELLDTAECFHTEEQMDTRIAELDRQVEPSQRDGATASLRPNSSAALASANCSGYLRLYGGVNYGSPVLYLRSRWTWLNLSAFGFNNQTSSYKVGPCSAYFADLSNGGGDWYPTYVTEAYNQSSNMISGWNNDVSSVYLN